MSEARNNYCQKNNILSNGFTSSKKRNSLPPKATIASHERSGMVVMNVPKLLTSATSLPIRQLFAWYSVPSHAAFQFSSASDKGRDPSIDCSSVPVSHK